MAQIPFDCAPPFGPAEQLANHMIHVAAERGMAMTHQRLQICLYYAQGYSLAFLENLLFPEQIAVSAEGPMVREVEERFARYGTNEIPYSEDMCPQRRAYHPGALLGTILQEFEQLDDHELAKKLRLEAHWQASCRAGVVADPRLVASWWCDKLESRIRNRQPQPAMKLSEHLKRDPDLARRLREPSKPEALIPWR